MNLLVVLTYHSKGRIIICSDNLQFYSAAHFVALKMSAIVLERVKESKGYRRGSSYCWNKDRSASSDSYYADSYSKKGRHRYNSFERNPIHIQYTINAYFCTVT
ncbi:hypothetical protein GCM10007390_24790 [Persicitalea jodogahamensis]|uniref:Uncharacterized protein n=1 Tax=Persicitalea jodogahamensis TaxID=402147 RepID=A0A8J3G8Y1_9BACT|nr:hypothetical protein GCM10007390_24790 [Persicitalea jodogahamensis]